MNSLIIKTLLYKNTRCIAKKLQIPSKSSISGRYSFHDIIRTFVTNDESYPDQEIITAILNASLLHVPLVGWTDEAIALGAKDLSLSPITLGVLENGPVVLVHHFLHLKRIQVKKHMSNQSQSSSSSESQSSSYDDIHHNPLYQSISQHIEIIKPHRSNWPSAIALLLDPRHFIVSSSLLFRTIDDFCEYSDIHATQLDWYTERGLLLAIYSITELYMLGDDSEELFDTKEFLGRILKTYDSIKKSPSTLAVIRDSIQGFVYDISSLKK